MTEATVADRRVHPGSIVLRFFKEAPSAVFGLPAAFAFFSKSNLWVVLGVAAAIGAVVVFVNWLGWRSFRYGVAAREIVIESGILSRNRRSIPFDRVQDIDIERGLLARMFGLAKVKIETGAGGKDEGVLDSVTVAEADRLRAAVRAWHAHGASLAQAAEPAEAEAVAAAAPAQEGRLLFAMDLKRVLVFGLFSFSLVYIASLFALLQTFDQALPFDIYDPARWVGLVEHNLPGRLTAAAIFFLLFLAVLLGIVAGLARTVARDYGYQLLSEGSRFRRERGLFTRTEAVIAKARVQLALVSSGPIRGRFGWSGLFFQTLGAGSDGSGLQAAAPFAKREEIAAILADGGALRLPPPPELTMVSSRHIVRAIVASCAPALVAILLGGFFFPPALFLLTLLPLLGAAAALQRRFHRYALNGELLFIARGIWRQRLWILPVSNVQAISVARSWLQRRLGLATLSIDTAGAPLARGARIVDVRRDLAEALAAEIAAGRRLHCSGRKSGTER
ncbi:MAG TPA: PH domain-containing protein [Allosphingosinicella sp.]